MAKTKTSRKPAFCFKDLPIRRLKDPSVAKEYDPTTRLRDPKQVTEALMECLKDGDANAFKEILSAHLAIVKKEAFYKKAGISRRTMFRILSPEGNPTLDNIARIVKTIAA